MEAVEKPFDEINDTVFSSRSRERAAGEAWGQTTNNTETIGTVGSPIQGGRQAPSVRDESRERSAPKDWIKLQIYKGCQLMLSTQW